MKQLTRQLSPLALALSSAIFISACADNTDTTSLLNQAGPAASFEQSSGKVIAGYFADWRVYAEKPYTPSQIPAGDLTHVIYAFLTMCGPHPDDVGEKLSQQISKSCEGKAPFTAIVADQEAAYGMTLPNGETYEGHFEQFKVLKENNPHLTVLPSFGGWTMSAPFHEMIKTEAGRQQFVKSAVALVEQSQIFDGIDIDWEYPGGGGLTSDEWNPDTKFSDQRMAFEKEMFTLLLKDLRAELDLLSAKTGRKYELSSAAGVAPSKVKNIDYPAASQYIDNWFAMSYDLFGAWSLENIGYQSNLKGSGDLKWWSGVDGYVAGMLKAGLPANKLVVGSAFYARGWSGLSNYPEGRPYAKNEDGTYAKAEKGISEDLSYHHIVAFKNDEKSGWVEFYDEKHEASYLWNEQQKAFLTYDNPRAVKAKAAWAVDQGFAGIFAWELTHDSNNELVKAMNEGVANKAILK